MFASLRKATLAIVMLVACAALALNGSGGKSNPALDRKSTSA
jgi:hypothetical protein